MADAEQRRGPPGRGDLTQGSIGPTLLKFALPTLASSIIQSLNGTVNAIWVGRFLGENALAATSNANIVMFLLISFVFGFGMAATILVGQAFGRRDVDQARRVVERRRARSCSSAALSQPPAGSFARQSFAFSARRQRPHRWRSPTCG